MKSIAFPFIVSIALITSPQAWALESNQPPRETKQYLPFVTKAPPISIELSGCTDPGTGQYFGGGYIALIRNNESRSIFINQYMIEYKYEEAPQGCPKVARL